MSDPNTLRILEIDGGGQRGYLSLKFFQHFVNLWGIDPATIANQFDVICGTSVGGIMASSLAFGLTPDEMVPFFTTQGPYIFSLTSLVPSVRPNLAAKLALIATDTPFYQSSGSDADQYGSGLLYKTVQTTFGSHTLQDLKTNVIIPVYEQDTNIYRLFSNLEYSEFIGQNELISNVGLATGAAPIYLPALQMNGHIYWDGGVFQNNPAQFGRTLAQMIKPTCRRTCLLSLGTGRGTMGFDPGNPDVMDARVFDAPGIRAFNSIQALFSLFEISSQGGQESIAEAMLLESRYTLNQFYFYRFQPVLDPALNTELDNTDPEIMTYYETVAEQSFNNDIANITAFLGHLTA